MVKYGGSEFWVSVYFKRAVKLVKQKTVMAIDLNFDNITLAVFTMSGILIKLKRFKTPLRRILTHRMWIERVQKRYPRSWRFIKGIKRAIKKHGERIKNISWDYSHKVGDLIADLALRYSSIIVLENLGELRNNAKKNREFNKKLTHWFYRRVQLCIEYETRERGLRIVKVNPKGTSSKCPKCSNKLVEDGYRTLRCRNCGFIGNRDVIATINLYMRFSSKYSRCGELGVSPKAPKPNENPSGMQGTRMRRWKHINSYKLI